jgi:hypothetical protein
VDDPAEDVMATNFAGDQGVVTRRRGSELKSAVRASLVVVADVFGKHGFKMSSGVHEEMVKAFFPYGPHPPLGERTGVRIAAILMEESTASKEAVNSYPCLE